MYFINVFACCYRLILEEDSERTVEVIQEEAEPGSPQLMQEQQQGSEDVETLLTQQTTS